MVSVHTFAFFVSATPRASSRVRLSPVALALAFGILSGSFGCAGGTQNIAQTNVARAELFRTENPKYDQFFEDVNSIQKDATGAETAEKKAHEPLEQALSLGESSVDALSDQVVKRLKSFAEGKPKLRVILDGLDEHYTPALGKSVTVTVSEVGASARKKVPHAATDFAKALEATARKEGQILETCTPIADKADRRIAVIEELKSSVDTDFASLKGNKRGEIRAELSAAHTVLWMLSRECVRAKGRASTFLQKSAESIAAVNESLSPPKKDAKAGNKTNRSKKP